MQQCCDGVNGRLDKRPLSVKLAFVTYNDQASVQRCLNACPKGELSFMRVSLGLSGGVLDTKFKISRPLLAWRAVRDQALVHRCLNACPKGE